MAMKDSGGVLCQGSIGRRGSTIGVYMYSAVVPYNRNTILSLMYCTQVSP